MSVSPASIRRPDGTSVPSYRVVSDSRPPSWLATVARTSLVRLSTLGERSNDRSSLRSRMSSCLDSPLKLANSHPRISGRFLTTRHNPRSVGSLAQRSRGRVRACGTSCGQGQASLGVLRPERAVRIDMREFEEGMKIKATVPFGTETTSVPVTDVRLYEADCITPSRTRFDRMSRLLRSGHPVLLAVGLARAWSANDPAAVHWLQVNGIFVNDGALWRDGDDRA